MLRSVNGRQQAVTKNCRRHRTVDRRAAAQAFKSCNGILNFAKRVGNDRLAKACKRAHEGGDYNFGIIEEILMKNLDSCEEESIQTLMPSHENIRGGNYYQ